MIPVPIGLDTNRDHHPEYGSPLDPAPGWKWKFDSRTHRLLPAISDEPDRFSTPQRRLYRWHPDQGHFSLVREDDDDGEDYELYEYDTNFGRGFFKPYQPR
jgi:hypothetical protein